MVRMQGQLSDESTSNSRRVTSSYRGRGARGRGRGKYPKPYHRDTYNDHSEHQLRSKQSDTQTRYQSEDLQSLEYENDDVAVLDDRENMEEDLYDDRPVQDTGLDSINENNRSHHDTDRMNDHYDHSDGAGNKVMTPIF